jgi:hypothetical protein
MVVLIAAAIPACRIARSHAGSSVRVSGNHIVICVSASDGRIRHTSRELHRYRPEVWEHLLTP